MMLSPLVQPLCLLILFYFVAFECNCKGYEAPPDCARVDCPSYTVIYSEKEFEVRSYEKAFWVATPDVKCDSILGAYEYTGNVYTVDYFFGKNEEHVRIDRASPALMDALGYFCRRYEFLAQKYQNGSIPKPLDPAITIEKLPKYKYAVARRFLEDYSDGRIAVEIDALKRNLQGTIYQRAAASDVFTIAYYNLPTQYYLTQYMEVIIWFD